MLKYCYNNVVNFIGIFVMKLDTILQNFGLTPKEASLYLATLELGSASVQKIAAKSGLVRSTAYEILEVLRRKGLVTTFLKKHIRHYSAEDPNQVLNFAQSRVDTLKEALPELQALVGKSRQRPTVRFYEGKGGIQIVLNEILAEANELLGIAADEVFRELEFFKNFTTRRKKNKIPIRLILPDSPGARERQRVGPQNLRQVKLIPTRHIFHGLMYIWKNKIAQISVANDFVAVVTESQELADMQRALFENLWDSLS